MGMHRSGTSLLTASLPLFGADIGQVDEHIAPPAPQDPDTNRKGYFELQAVVDIDEALLAVMRRSWEAVGPWPDNWLTWPSVKTLQDIAAEYISHRFESVPLFGLKDPRMSRLLPFWQGVFAKAGVAPSAIVTIRHPLAVADSLSRRDGLTREHGLALWLSHTLAMIRDTRHWPRVVVDYDDVLTRPEHQLQRIADGLGLDPPHPTASARYAANFVDKNMRHHRYSPDDPAMEPMVAQVYGALKRAIDENLSADGLDQALIPVQDYLLSLGSVWRYLAQREEREKTETPVVSRYRAWRHAFHDWRTGKRKRLPWSRLNQLPRWS